MKGTVFMKKDNETKKLPGFYIALCCCVIAIGAAGFVIGGEDSEDSVDTPTVAESTDTPYVAYEGEIEVADNSAEVTEDNTGEDVEIMDSVPAQIPTEDFTLDNPDVVSAAVVVNAEEEHMFTSPVPEMTIKFGLSCDTLMYNEYYKDWRTHNGIDIDAPLGCSVNATADGTVKKVAKGSYGNTVTIEHADGFKSVYAQLGEVNVKEGDVITQGSVIGTVGESIGENLTDSHLHYELYKDNKPVNPEEY